MTTSSTCGTARAASTPRTSRNTPPPVGTGIIITPEAVGSRSNDGIGIPNAWRTMISSRDAPVPSPESPVPNRSAPLHRPPIGRAASSITQGPLAFTRSSACTGPSRRPSAAAARSAHAATARCWSAGRRDGVT